ncbi:MAG: S-adenosylmethionine:tRNA ribosyltransferase-isomerase, partial [Anaerolineae bacterium]|nr:S-adenosylmethionine:tRNA ribosyltransferase-isomerase [Anaerolineae bacterium]
MKLTDFDYVLPPERIAQQPLEPRDSSRLMVLHRQNGTLEHRQFRDVVDYLKSGDVLVLNQTRVIPARLHAYKTATGGAVEILLLKQVDALRWNAVVGGKKVGEGVELALNGGKIKAVIEAVGEESQRLIRFNQPIEQAVDDIGEMPLPPYIKETLQDPERYQTVYSRTRGSAAAPTAGLHFTGELLM